MGFALPSGVVNTDSVYFYAGNASIGLGPYVKQPSDQTLVTLDYSQLSPSMTVVNYQFTTDVVSNPQLVVSYPQLDPTNTVLTFLLSGGIAGQQYNISISVNSSTRVDVLTVNIPSSSDCDCDAINPVPAIYNQIPLWGGGYVNSAVRLFWGSTAPANPNVLDQWYNTTSQALLEYMTDGTQSFWNAISSSGYVTDAPLDGSLYGRKSAVWSHISHYDITDWAAYVPAGSTSAPIMNGIASTGSSFNYSRADHVHPSDTSRLALSGGTMSGTLGIPTPSLLALGGGLLGQVLTTNGGAGLSWTQPSGVFIDAPSDGQYYSRRNAGWTISPAGLTDAASDGTLYARKTNAWVHVTSNDIADWATSGFDCGTF